jgi:hypothetical protein
VCVGRLVCAVSVLSVCGTFGVCCVGAECVSVCVRPLRVLCGTHHGGEDEVDAARAPVDDAVQRARLPAEVEAVVQPAWSPNFPSPISQPLTFVALSILPMILTGIFARGSK